MGWYGLEMLWTGIEFKAPDLPGGELDSAIL